MSRYGRGRGGSVALPLDSNLFRENTNCPSAARSAGTVGKWGITSFTSIRSAPYAFVNNIVKKPVQDQNRPLTVAPLETEAPPPKPKKFFKSRNVPDSPATMPQPVFAPPVAAHSRSPSPEYLPSTVSRRRGTKAGRSPAGGRDTSPDPPRRTKNKPPTKAAKKEDPTETTHLSPNKRYLVRNRDKVINYAEDRSNSPIPDLSAFDSLAPTHSPEPAPTPAPIPALSPAQTPTPVQTQAPVEVPVPQASPIISSPTYVKSGLVSPSSKDAKPPPIVLRISKGTSRIVSTDSNEGLTSPGSDRHSDNHVDIDTKMSPSLETIRSPKHEGLKITIKCSSFNKESKKKEKKDRSEEKEKRAQKRNHRKSSDDEPLIRKVSSPQPGTENYDLYRTLASPSSEKVEALDKPVKEHKKEKSFEEIESELARLDSEEPVPKTLRTSPRAPTEPAPEPKPPEKISGRAMRHRATINYSENDDGLIDDLTSGRTSRHIPKAPILKAPIPKAPIPKPPIPKPPIPKPPKKSRRRAEALIAELVGAPLPPVEPEAPARESSPPVDAVELINILSGASESAKRESEPIKIKINKRHVLERLSPVHQQNNCGSESPEQSDAKEPSPERPVFKSPRHVDMSEEKPSVKLVITKKKGSIFKSKSLVNDSTSSPLPARKRRHLYKHQWDDDGKGNQTPRRDPEPATEPPGAAEPAQVSELSRVTRYRAPEPTARLPHAPEEEIQSYTSVRCPKGAKDFYTVVRNVKKAHQIQEIGEFQEFNDDVEYILDALQDNNPMSTRCLSAITLASKCTAPAFRMHVRAHGTVQKFFSALHDATNDQSLGLCTATVMFVLSQDRLNMDLDRESLELMLNLLESDVSHRNALDDCGLTSTQLAKNKERVRELCAEIKSQGKAKHLDLDNITVGHLAMETLLSLTSKRAGEWFKEELRVLGGVDHIVRTIQDCVSQLEAAVPSTQEWSPQLVDTLRKADRCMRVLENVTQQNEENQLYLVSERGAALEAGGGGVARTLATLLRLCCTQARRLPPHPQHLHAALLDAALPAIKVLVNLSHNFTPSSSLGATVVGQNVSVIETCLILLHNPGNFVPDNNNFEFCVCLLLLLINLVQGNPDNVMRLLELNIRTDTPTDPQPVSTPALHLLIQHFYRREELARLVEKNTDDILEGEKEEEDATNKKKQSQEDFVEETIAKLLAKAGAHMEHSMVGAYMVILLGHVAALSAELDEAVRARTRTRDYSLMISVLRKYFSFLNLTASAEAASVAHIKSTHKIIEFLEDSDKRHLELSQPPASHAAPYRPPPHPPSSPSDLPQDMSLSNLSGSDTSYN